MFSIDFPEIVIILGVALVVLGPKKLPVAAAKIGRWVGRARTMARQFREQLEQEVSSAENAADIRKTVDSVGTPTPKQPTGAVAAAEKQGAPPDATPRETVPQEAVAHGPSAHQSPYESGLYGMPPAEGYGPPPQQLSFDTQLHDTALPPDGAPSPAAHPGDAREWMPETQTWMASAGWEKPEPVPEDAAPAQQAPESTPRPTAQRPSPHDRASEPADATRSSPRETVEHGDR